MNIDFCNVGFLGFDVVGTIVDWRSGVARAADPFLEEHGLDVDPLDFADEWRSLYQPAMQRVRSGERPWVKLYVLNTSSIARTGEVDTPLWHRAGMDTAELGMGVKAAPASEGYEALKTGKDRVVSEGRRQVYRPGRQQHPARHR